ncbi:MAG: signal peptidase II [Planctomycetota bacterium]
MKKNLLDQLFLRRKIFWIITIVIFVADLWSKEAAISHVRDAAQGNICWVQHPWFALVDVSNKGGPWGVGREFSKALRIVRMLALGVILFILMGTPYNSRIQVISLSLVMGGALGNIWDSWVFGHVRDFLYFDLGFAPANPWPAFNLADSAICVGVAGLALTMLCTGFSQRHRVLKEPGKDGTGEN